MSKAARHTKAPLGIRAALCLVISGCCVGILTGLSVSPVVGIVLTGLVSTLVAVTSALAGLQVDDSSETPEKSEGNRPPRRDPFTIDPLPVAIVATAMVAGSMSGIWVRTHGWLGTVPANGAIGVVSHAAADAPAFRQGVLFSLEASQCDDLRATDVPGNDEAFGASVIRALEGDPNLADVARGCRDRPCLRALVRAVCP